MDSDLTIPPSPNGAIFDESQVPIYYSHKTPAILQKYGPGPRVHFHMGLFDSTPNTTISQSALRCRIVASQEAIVAHAARQWAVDEAPPKRLLDVGCGVGGGSLYWAQEWGAQVTGVTVTPDHIGVISDFARQAGVADRVTPVLADIHEWAEQETYDGAYANESSGYMDRERLFEVVARALKPRGWFGIQEHFVCRPEWTEFIDGYYKTRLGTLTEYITAAQAAGFELEQNEDVTDRVAEFWVQSAAWNTAELDRLEASDTEPTWTRERLLESTATHRKLFWLWRDHAVETRLLFFRLRHGRS